MSSLVLASASQRRQQILSALGLTFTVAPSSLPEQTLPHLAPELACQHLALQKALAASIDFSSSHIIASDTLVWQDGTFFGKPRDVSHAVEMLSALSDRNRREHFVFSSLALIEPNVILDEEVSLPPSDSARNKKNGQKNLPQIYLSFESARVRFKNLSLSQIESYVQEGESLDKAAGYAAQGKGQQLIESIEGSFYTVMGFPVYEFLRLTSGWALTPSLPSLLQKIPAAKF